MPAERRIVVEGRAKLHRWRADPVAMVREAFAAEPDPAQIDILRAFSVKQRIAAKACKGPGKTAALAWCAWNFLATRPHPNIAATSITGDNLSDGLWKEMAKWRARSAFFTEAFEWTRTRIFARDHPETWFMSARTWPRTADPQAQAETLAGLHADYLLFILDESGGIPDAVMAAAEAALATGKEMKLLQAGNPTRLDGPLYRACTSERHLWHLVEITGDPEDPNRSPRIDAQWAREQIEKWGRDNPWVLVNVFGKFPPSSINSLLGPDEISAAMRRQPKDDDYSWSAKLLGVDVARFGDDRTVIFPRQGLASFNPVIMRNANSLEVAARVAQACERWGVDAVFVDDTGGFGAGVIDQLAQAGHPMIPVSFSGKAMDSRYLNKRAEMHFEAAEWVRKGGALPNVPELTREASAPTYTFRNGKFQIEEKDQIKARIGVSPDLWDAFALTFALPVAPPVRTGVPAIDRRGRYQADYDPFEERS